MMFPEMRARLHELDAEIAELDERGIDASVLVAERRSLWLALRELECELVGCGG